ncbi:MAG: SPFH domain-containing protein, partial [Firmicutes bacterium]|nr:SPFH domain-containing protein [Bacillota bacterium]
MGLIKAIAGAAGGVLADSWRDYFYCESLPADILVTKGAKRQGKRSSNTKGSDNIITNGSIVAVADGQCMILVDQGKVTELCAEPGEFVYESGTEASIFYGGLGQGIKATFRQIGKRFTFGGEAPKDQRVYYFNLKEIPGNKYGTAAPVPFRVVDRNIGLDIDIAIRCNGEFSYKIADPILFYTNVCGNVSQSYNRGEIDSMLRTELLTALQPAFARISEMGIRYSALPGHAAELADALNEVLSKKWTELRGLKVFSFGVNSVTASKEDEDLIKQLQRGAVMRDPTMAGAQLTAAQADAMRAAASNTAAGPAMAFMGMNMAG